MSAAAPLFEKEFVNPVGLKCNSTEESKDSSTIFVSLEEKLEGFLENVGNGKKPWFLSSVELFKVVEKVVMSIPLTTKAVDHALQLVSLITHYIQINTKLNVVLDVDKCYEIISQIEDAITMVLTALDDGLDGLRFKVSLALKKLLNAVVEHEEWAISYLDGKSKVLATKLSSFIDKLKAFSADLMNLTKNKYPRAFAASESLITFAVDKIRETVYGVYQYFLCTYDNTTTCIQDTMNGNVEKTFATSAYILKTAQPYVHSAVDRSQPIVTHAIEVSQPYVTRAKPYFNPLVVQVSALNVKLQENKTIGPYLTRALETAEFVYEETKTYCLKGPEVETQNVPAVEKAPEAM